MLPPGLLLLPTSGQSGSRHITAPFLPASVRLPPTLLLQVSGVTCTIVIKRFTAQWVMSAILPIVASAWLGYVTFLLPRCAGVCQKRCRALLAVGLNCSTWIMWGFTAQAATQSLCFCAYLLIFVYCTSCRDCLNSRLGAVMTIFVAVAAIQV